MKDMYYDSKKSFVCESDKKLKKVQQKLYDVMGPLGTLWKNLSKARNNSTKTVSGAEIIELIDQSVILLGQANNSINFIRRLAGLTSLGVDKVQAASMLKQASADFKPKSDKLFGKNFYKTLKHRTKDQRKTKEKVQSTRPLWQRDVVIAQSKPWRRGRPTPQRRSPHSQQQE